MATIFKLTEAERQAAEAARKQREAVNAGRIAEIERAAREQALAGLTPEEIRKAEELVSWDYIKDRRNIATLRDHLARFPGGSTERNARAKLEALVWAIPATQASIEALTAFLDEFPNGDTAESARAQLQALEADRDAARQAEELIEQGAPGIHFYVLNKSRAAALICRALALFTPVD